VREVIKCILHFPDYDQIEPVEVLPPVSSWSTSNRGIVGPPFSLRVRAGGYNCPLVGEGRCGNLALMCGRGDLVKSKEGRGGEG
jgi:hypothetical protein